VFPDGTGGEPSVRSRRSRRAHTHVAIESESQVRTGIQVGPLARVVFATAHVESVGGAPDAELVVREDQPSATTVTSDRTSPSGSPSTGTSTSVSRSPIAFGRSSTDTVSPAICTSFRNQLGARYAGIQFETSHAVTYRAGGCARVADAIIPFLETL